jgi:hypothetical protein
MRQDIIRRNMLTRGCNTKHNVVRQLHSNKTLHTNTMRL